MTLNPNQHAAAHAPGRGNIRINALAGTGKTSTILKRLEHLNAVASGPMKILAFNKAVVEELKVKLKKQVDPFAAGRTTVETSMGFAFGMVRRNFRLLGFSECPTVPPDWKVTKDSIEWLKKHHQVSLVEIQMKALAAAESWRRGAGKPDYSEFASRSLAIGKMMQLYPMTDLMNFSAALFGFRRSQNWCPFMDMLSLALELPPAIYEDLDIDHLLVDEAQDLNTQQHELVWQVTRFTKTLTIVGDPNQAIYSFSGARPDLFHQIPVRYAATDFVLDVNYRSKQPILDLANRLLSRSDMDTKLRLQSNGIQEGGPVQFYKNPEDVVFWLQSLIDGGVPPSDIAMAFRARSHTFELEYLLATAEIPYRSSGGSFFDHAVISDVMAYYSLLLGKPDEETWKKVVKHRKYMSNAAIDAAWAAKPHAPWQYLPTAHFKNQSQQRNWISMQTQLNGLLDNISNQDPAVTIAELVRGPMGGRWEDHYADDPELEREYKMMQGALQDMSSKHRSGRSFYNSILKRPEPSSEGVLISSTHRLKGLEFPYVGIWLAGNRSFPLRADDAEEIRLVYVAVTRAKDELAVFAHRDSKDGGVLGLLIPDMLEGLSAVFS